MRKNISAGKGTTFFSYMQKKSPLRAIFMMFRYSFGLSKRYSLRNNVWERSVNIGTTAGDMHDKLAWLYYPLMCICIEEGQHIGRNAKGHLFGLARLQCHFRKTFQFLLRANNGCLAVRYIELYYLLSCTCARIGNRDRDLITIQGSFAVCECCIAQAKTEWESRFAFRRIDGVLYALGHILQRTACAI